MRISPNCVEAFVTMLLAGKRLQNGSCQTGPRSLRFSFYHAHFSCRRVNNTGIFFRKHKLTL